MKAKEAAEAAKVAHVMWRWRIVGKTSPVVLVTAIRRARMIEVAPAAAALGTTTAIAFAKAAPVTARTAVSPVALVTTTTTAAPADATSTATREPLVTKGTQTEYAYWD